jgi:peptidoglycan/LPS O-acetylase OafA/YrhL
MSAATQAFSSNEVAASVLQERRQYQTLDGLRGVAALSVVVLHTPHFFAQWHLPYSFLSVDLFFVLSGFVLAAAYETRLCSDMTPAHFIRIRLIRLYPLYLLGTLLGVPVALMAMKYGGGGLSVDWSPRLFAFSLPLSLAMLPTPPATMDDAFLYPFNPVLWTILFEIIVNGIYALLARPLQNTRLLIALVTGSAVALVASVLWTGDLEGGASWFTFGVGICRMMFSFFCGVLVFRIRWPNRIHSLVLALALLAVLLLLLGTPHTTLTALVTVLVLFPAIVQMGSAVEPGRGLQRAFGLLGVTSYAVYAVHKPLYQILLGFLIKVSPTRPETMAPWTGLAYLVLVFLACLVIDRFYDMPVRSFLNRLGARRRAPSAELAE